MEFAVKHEEVDRGMGIWALWALDWGQPRSLGWSLDRSASEYERSTPWLANMDRITWSNQSHPSFAPSLNLLVLSIGNDIYLEVYTQEKLDPTFNKVGYDFWLEFMMCFYVRTYFPLFCVYLFVSWKKKCRLFIVGC